MNPGRLLVVVILLIGIVVAGGQLRSLNVPFIDVLVTGAATLLSFALLFLILIGAGKLLGWMFSGGEDDTDETGM